MNAATRFFISLIPASKGMIPRNRAVCQACAESFRFDQSVKNGSVREVPEAVWLEVEHLMRDWEGSHVRPLGVDGQADCVLRKARRLERGEPVRGSGSGVASRMTGILLRRATLIDVNYHVVKEVPVPIGIRAGDAGVAASVPWPGAIRYEGRVFTQYAYTMPDTIEAKRQADLDATYREITVYEATP